jgi:hypothetical protein
MVQIEFGGNLIFVVNMYIPPSYPQVVKSEMLSAPLELANSALPYIICGDWNTFWPSDSTIPPTRGSSYLDHI